MKIIVIGGSGTIGKAIVKELGKRHQVLVADRSKADLSVDINNPDSIEKMFQSVKDVDAVIAAAGQVEFKKVTEITADDYYVGINSKLMGQVNLVLIGQKYLKPGGSFTLTGGILSQDPVPLGSSASMVNAALEGFVIGAAIEMPNALRINVVSPTLITESADIYEDYFPGFPPVPAALVALAYSKSVEGAQTGKIYKVGY